MNTIQRPTTKESSSRTVDLNRNRFNSKNTAGNSFGNRKGKSQLRIKKTVDIYDMAYEDMLNCCD